MKGLSLSILQLHDLHVCCGREEERKGEKGPSALNKAHHSPVLAFVGANHGQGAGDVVSLCSQEEETDLMSMNQSALYT